MIQKQLYDVLEAKILEAFANSHTILVAKVVQVHEKTLDCQPVINRVVDGASVALPVFPEVPPVFLQGGASYTAHPVTPGDYCLLLISERCFDHWYNGSDNLPPLDGRMFDYSDAFAIVGVNPLAAAITIPKVITQIGDTYQQGDYEHDGNTEQRGDYKQTGNFTLDGDFTHTGDTTQIGNVTQTGNKIMIGNLAIAGGLAVSGQGGNPTQINGSDCTIIIANGDVIVDGISLKNHTHPYSWTAAAGSGNTGAAQ